MGEPPTAPSGAASAGPKSMRCTTEASSPCLPVLPYVYCSHVRCAPMSVRSASTSAALRKSAHTASPGTPPTSWDTFHAPLGDTPAQQRCSSAIAWLSSRVSDGSAPELLPSDAAPPRPERRTKSAAKPLRPGCASGSGRLSLGGGLGGVGRRSF